ncbi:MAG: C-5 cytosine-specific DNA methylase [Phage 67_12]|nr:MAG: C-5 cytosine-specific DNA methylase [Phage 67_12]
MIGNQFLLGIAAELVIDLFAGGGGASTGIEQAIGRHVDIAVNHDAKAVSLHEANHPQTQHFVADVFEVDPLTVTEGRPVGLLWASPDCKHFSKAKGGKPVSKKIRGLAWVVVDWARAVRPRVICLENVEEFKTWGPLTDDNMPDPARRGETFDEWKGQLEALGYVVEHRELRACDYGAPTIRKRLFLVARCDGAPIVWPKATHAAAPAKGSDLKPYRTAADCIDWTIPCPSIFERERELAPATLRRIAHGIKRYVLDAAKPFIVPVTHPGDARVHSVDEPFRTITGANRGELALSAPTITRIGQTGHGDAGKSRRADEPLSTVTSKAEHLLVAPTLAGLAHADVDGRARRPDDLSAPVSTIHAGGGNHALCAAFLAKHYGGNETPGIAVDGPISTITTQDHHHLVAAHVSKFRTGSVGSDLGDPLHTVTAGGEQARPGTGNAMGLVTANLATLRGTSNSADVSAPLHTISAGGEHHGLVTSHLSSAGGPAYGGKPRDIDAPMATITTENHAAEVRALLLKYYGTDQDPDLREPLHTVTTKDRFGLVTVKGEDYYIADIGMRMLQPRELYRAQGFPDSYIIDRGADGKSLPKSAQVRMCGNSVCPPLARAIVLANFVDAAMLREAA